MKAMKGIAWPGAVSLGLTLLALAVVAMAPAASAAAPGASAAGPGVGAGCAPDCVTFLPLIRREAARNVWLGEYYANPDLSGAPAYSLVEKRVDYDWGATGHPAGLPADFFSIRWTGYWNLEIGDYTFLAYADDGLRLWLDGQLLIDLWQPGMGSYDATAFVSTAGPHELKLEYFEETGGAAIRLQWRRTDHFPRWQGDYYSNPWLNSPRLYSQVDPVLQFDWDVGCPAWLPDCDAFSIRWNATALFLPGTQRIYAYADEGYQLFVDGTKVKEGGWLDGQPGGAVDAYYDLDVKKLEHHQLTYNVHDRGGPAEARLWIENLDDPWWDVQYYANDKLRGSPVRTEHDASIFHDWGLGVPHSGVPADGFSIRWKGQRYFHAGCYRFGMFADDGVRLWVDGELLIDEWHDGRTTYASPLTYVDSGFHEVTVEYYDGGGEAEIRFWWE